jgi:3-hydroxyacyl-[acyl-carrier-protein] dehydratase
MLTGSLFNILEITKAGEGEFCISFNCNQGHDIFKGHFPGEPILPGVCMVQFVRESVENAFKRNLKLKSSKTVKFVHIIDPRKEEKLVLEFKATVSAEGKIETKAAIKNENTVFFQMRALFE